MDGNRNTGPVGSGCTIRFAFLSVGRPPEEIFQDGEEKGRPINNNYSEESD